MIKTTRLPLASGDDIVDPESYRCLIGKLFYLGYRPDLAYVIHTLSQFMNHPKEDHWQVVLKVVRYLKGTLGKGILLRPSSPLHLIDWCDSDWTGCLTTRRSLSAWIVQLGDSPVCWKTEKQWVVSISSAEAKYRAMVDTTNEIKWLKDLLLEFGIDHKAHIMSLFCNSQYTLQISVNLVFHEALKWIVISYEMIFKPALSRQHYYQE